MDRATWERKKEIAKYLQTVIRRRKDEKKKAQPQAQVPPPPLGRYASSRGIASPEGNRSLILVRSPIAKAAKGLAHVLGVERWKKDAWGKEVRIAGRCFALWQYVGQDWTIVWPFGEESSADLQDLADELSSTLEGKAIFFSSDDDLGETRYTLLDDGKEQERFYFMDSGQLHTLLARIRKLDKRRQTEVSELKKAKGLLFVSKLRKQVSIAKPLVFVDEFIRSQDAYIPPLEFHAQDAKKLNLSFHGIEPQDIVRMDWVSDQ
jgi:hypothetical protein